MSVLVVASRLPVVHRRLSSRQTMGGDFSAKGQQDCTKGIYALSGNDDDNDDYDDNDDDNDWR